jgi:hypothetical protein
VKLRFGVVSSDSHGQLHKDAFTRRMSKAKFGDRIPQLAETSDKANMSDPVDRVVERWRINGKFVEKRGVSNCAAYMNDPLRATFPQARYQEEAERAAQGTGPSLLVVRSGGRALGADR